MKDHEIKTIFPLIKDAKNSLLKGQTAPALSAINAAIKYLEDLKDARKSVK
jgi:hypothetical protein